MIRRRVQEDISGKKYGRLTAIKAEYIRGNKYYWLFRCDCGNEKIAAKSDVKIGNVRSCGCLFKDIKTLHGHTSNKRSPTYITWDAMKARCNNKNNPYYHNYGGRGIKVCDRWLDLRNFIEDMGVRPEGKSLDRIDNDGDYELDNCKWSSKREQDMNRRGTVLITYHGKKKCLKDWCKEFNLNYSSACYRRRKNPDWNLENEIKRFS